jgi:multisite-specific tRNA:(cytosine-C5)-methyltransferase
MEPFSLFRERLVLPLWRSLHSLNLMLAKDERKAMLLRLFNDDTPLKDRSKDRFAQTPKDGASTSTLHGTTAERAEEAQRADTVAAVGEAPVEEDDENEIDDDEETKIGQADNDGAGAGFDVGSGAGIMMIGGAD